MNRLQLKSDSKVQIKGKIGALFVIALIISAISGVAGIVPEVGSVITLLITPPFSLSMAIIYLTVVNGGSIEVADTFKGFSNYIKAFSLNMLIFVFTFLWSLLFVIPGIVKSYSYSMAMYILAENPEMTASEALNLSKEMTEGHKMELFMLDLSFIGWIILSIFTAGLVFIWAGPYIYATKANAYLYLKSLRYGDYTL